MQKKLHLKAKVIEGQTVWILPNGMRIKFKRWGHFYMNHEQLKTAINKQINGTVKPADIDRVLLAAAGILAQELRAGNKVTVKDIGTFATLAMAERMGTNPKTGEKVLIPATKRVKLKPCVALKNKVQ